MFEKILLSIQGAFTKNILHISYHRYMHKYNKTIGLKIYSNLYIMYHKSRNT